jgi:hypothetical protein
MKKRTQHDGGVERGVTVGGATGLVMVAALYAELAPTSDIRARIPFLLEMSGGALTLIFVLGFWLVAAVGLLSTRALNRRSLMGAVIPSFAYVALIASGTLTRLVPEFDTSGPAAVAMGLCVAISSVLLIREARMHKRESLDSATSDQSHLNH